MPQSPDARELENVIRGHFRDLQHVDWAVVCDLHQNDASLLLVYWGGDALQPSIVAKSSVSHETCWSTIMPVGSAYIMEHYRAYGGPKPPPIDHQGIDVSICDKASTISYFDRSHRLTLTGAD